MEHSADLVIFIATKGVATGGNPVLPHRSGERPLSRSRKPGDVRFRVEAPDYRPFTRSSAAAISRSITSSEFSSVVGSGTGVTSFVRGSQFTGP